jgi:hypothetical protein
MPREVQSSKNNTGRYRAHPDITIRIPASCRDLPVRDNGPEYGDDATDIAPTAVGNVETDMLRKSEERS